MAMGYMSPKDFEKKFKINQSQNPQGAEINEGLSGQAQLLKSSDNSVMYKNFNGGDIEETNLHQDAYNRTIQTDQTDQYDSGVTTNQLEVASQITKQTILTQSQSTTINNLTENVNTTDHRETSNLNQEVYIQNNQENIPTNLQQKINNFGGMAAQSLKRQGGTKNIKSQNYTESFGNMKTQGDMFVTGNGSINGPRIYIGAPPPDGRLDFTLKKIANQYFPTVSAQVLGSSLPLGVFKTANFLITGQLDLEVDLNAQNKISVNPVGFDQKGLSVDLCETINQYYANLDIDSATGLEELPNKAPSVGVSFADGSFEFKNAISINTIGQAGVRSLFEVTYETETDNNVIAYNPGLRLFEQDASSLSRSLSDKKRTRPRDSFNFDIFANGFS